MSDKAQALAVKPHIDSATEIVGLAFSPYTCTKPGCDCGTVALVSLVTSSGRSLAVAALSADEARKLSDGLAKAAGRPAGVAVQ